MSQDDRSVELLLRLAGPREAMPADRMARLQAAAHAEWMRHVESRRRRRAATWWLSAAAAAAAVVLAAWWVPRAGPASNVPPAFATAEAVGGAATLALSSGGSETAPLMVGGRVPVGREASTSSSGTATLRLPGGALLRMDAESALHLAAADAIVLTRGAVYVEADAAPSLEVRTPFGIVRDVGTTFEVRLTPAGLRVRVREGAVQVRGGRREHEARAGDEITLDASGEAVRRAIAVDDPQWAWVTGVVPPFKIEGRSLGEFLDWVARQNRWELRFADAAVEEKARTTTLHGSIQGLTAEQALAAVVPVSGLEHRLEQRVLSIQRNARGKD